MPRDILSILTACLLLFAASPVAAEWVQMSENTEGMTFHVDTETLKRNGHMARAWVLQSAVKPIVDGALSAKSLTEYNCDETSFRLLTFVFYAQPMGKGTVIAQGNGKGEWSYAPPGSSHASLLKQVCDETAPALPRHQPR